MMKINLIAIILLSLLLSCTQHQRKNDCLMAYIDTTSGTELIGYKTLQGEIIIPAKYQNGSDTLCGMAIVQTSTYEFVGIDRNDSILLKPYIYDNGPDYLEEGLFRFVEEEKIGFANLEGQKIIKAKYDFATPFYEGLSKYYIGGEQIYEDGRTINEIIQENGIEGLIDKHWFWGGNVIESGYINKQGQEFIEVTELKDNKREAWSKDKKHFLLNAQGSIIKQIDQRKKPTYF